MARSLMASAPSMRGGLSCWMQSRNSRTMSRAPLWASGRRTVRLTRVFFECDIGAVWFEADITFCAGDANLVLLVRPGCGAGEVEERDGVIGQVGDHYQAVFSLGAAMHFCGLGGVHLGGHATEVHNKINVVYAGVDEGAAAGEGGVEAPRGRGRTKGFHPDVDEAQVSDAAERACFLS